MDRPTAFNYLDYRAFLKDLIEFLRSQRKYSVRKFAQVVGFRSSNYMKWILDGRRSLTRKSLPKVLRALGLRGREADFFRQLVELGSTTDQKERERLLQVLWSTKVPSKTRRLRLNELRFYSDWRLVALYTALGSDRYAQKLPVLFDQLEMSSSEGERSLELLMELGLIERRDSRFYQTSSVLHTGSETHDLNVRSFHRTMIQRALECVDSRSMRERNLSSLTLCLTPSEYRFVIQQIDRLRAEIASRFSESKKATKVFQFNFQAFALIGLDKEQIE
jgi:uncharacterized protein (TIGR02147 family)